MPSSTSRLLLLAAAATPFVFVIAQQAPPQEPTSDQVFKNIQVFKGVPASDLIPSMEFMAASLKVDCSDCHDAKDFSAETRMKQTARMMVLMQRDINAKNFGGRNQVTCNTCHGGKENPAATPLPPGVSLRHPRLTPAPKPEELFAKHVAAAGNAPGALVLTGVLTAPNDATHKTETTPLEFLQAPGGKFRLVSGERKIVSDGTHISYGGAQMAGEPAAIFGRIGRAWRGTEIFSALERPTVAGKDVIGRSEVIIVRATRPSTTSTEELSFDTKTNLLVRLVNARRATLGNVVTSIDYSNYRRIGAMQVPMKVAMTFAGGEQWIMDFKSAKLDPNMNDSAFTSGK